MKKRSDKIEKRLQELIRPQKMLEQYKKTLKEQRPYWKKQRRVYKKAHQLPSDIMWEARKFRDTYRKPFLQPYGEIEEMYKQATDESTL